MNVSKVVVGATLAVALVAERAESAVSGAVTLTNSSQGNRKGCSYNYNVDPYENVPGTTTKTNN